MAGKSTSTAKARTDTAADGTPKDATGQDQPPDPKPETPPTAGTVRVRVAHARITEGKDRHFLGEVIDLPKARAAARLANGSVLPAAT